MKLVKRHKTTWADIEIMDTGLFSVGISPDGVNINISPPWESKANEHVLRMSKEEAWKLACDLVMALKP